MILESICNQDKHFLIRMFSSIILAFGVSKEKDRDRGHALEIPALQSTPREFERAVEISQTQIIQRYDLKQN